MKNRHTVRLVALVLIACCFLGMPMRGMAEGGMAFTPMEEAETYVFQYWLDEPNVSFYLPLTVRTELAMYLEDAKAVLMQSREMPSYEFIFFAFRFEESKTPLDKMTGEEIEQVLFMISNSPQNVTYELVKEFLPGVSVLRVWESREDVYAEHMLALRDGWLFNMMVRRFDGVEAVEQQATDFQARALQGALSEQRMLSGYALPDSDIQLTLQDPLRLFVTNAEPDCHRLSFVDPRPGIVVSTLTLTAVRDSAFKGKTVETLDKKSLDEIMRMDTVSGYDKDSVEAIKDESGVPMLAFTSAFSADAGSRHLLAMRDGWALLLTSIPIANAYTEWMADLRPSLMHSLLSGEPMAEVNPPIVPLMGGVTSNTKKACIPMDTKALVVAIPEGYGVDVVEDTEESRMVAIYYKEDQPKYYYIKAVDIGGDRDATMETLFDEETRESIGKTAATTAQNEFELETTYSYAKTGIFDMPSFFIENEHTVEYIVLVDGFHLGISFISHDEPITKAEKNSLLEIFTLVSAE